MNKVLPLCIIISICLALGACSYGTEKTSNEVKQDISGDQVKTGDQNKTVDQNSTIIEPESSSKADTDVDLDKFAITDKEDSEAGILIGVTENSSKGYYKFFFNKFEGVRTITELAKGSTFDVESSLESGKLSIVILDSDYKVLKVLSANKSESVKLDFADTDEYVIRAAGDGASKGNVIIQVK